LTAGYIHLFLPGGVYSIFVLEPGARDHGQAQLCQWDKDVGRDHAQFGIFLERLVVVDTVFAVLGGGAGLGL